MARNNASSPKVRYSQSNSAYRRWKRKAGTAIRMSPPRRKFSGRSPKDNQLPPHHEEKLAAR